MRAAFLDTVGLVALWDEDDQWHAPAEKAAAAFYTQPTRLVTTSFVLLECGNAAARRAYRADVNLLWRKLTREGNLIVPTAEDVDEAWLAYDCGEAADAGIVDHVSFVVMRRLGVADAFTNDRHFTAAGFNTLF
jgi:predicted nucleic acid-binding protein